MPIEIREGQGHLDLDRVKTFLKDTPWQSEIGEGTLERAIGNSLCFSAFDGSVQVGFARVVTDRATFAWIDDLYIDPQRRGTGIASQLVERIVESPELKSVATWLLSSGNPSARRIFQRFGFDVLEPPRSAKLMAIPKARNDHYRS